MTVNRAFLPGLIPGYGGNGRRTRSEPKRYAARERPGQILGALRHAHCDCVIRVPDRHAGDVASIHAHRAILARAAFFRSAFDTGEPDDIECWDAATGKPVLRSVYLLAGLDLDPDAVRYLVDCLYSTAKLDTIPESVDGVDAVEAFSTLGAPAYYTQAILAATIYALAYEVRHRYLKRKRRFATPRREAPLLVVHEPDDSTDPRMRYTRGFLQARRANTETDAMTHGRVFGPTVNANDTVHVKGLASTIEDGTIAQASEQLREALDRLADLFMRIMASAVAVDVKMHTAAWMAGALATDTRAGVFLRSVCPGDHSRRSRVGDVVIEDGLCWQTLYLAFDRVGLTPPDSSVIEWEDLAFRGYFYVGGDAYDDEDDDSPPSLYVCVECAPRDDTPDPRLSMCGGCAYKHGGGGGDDDDDGAPKTVPRLARFLARIYHPLDEPVTTDLDVHFVHRLGGKDKAYEARTGCKVPEGCTVVPTDRDQRYRGKGHPKTRSRKNGRVPAQYRIDEWGAIETPSRRLLACEVEIRVQVLAPCL